jgi:hypothetical protein
LSEKLKLFDEKEFGLNEKLKLFDEKEFGLNEKLKLFDEKEFGLSEKLKLFDKKEFGLNEKLKLFDKKEFAWVKTCRILIERFQFEKFGETRDSLFFYNLNDIESVDGRHVDSLKIKKTNVIIRQTKNHEIIQIVIDDLIFEKDSNSIIQYQPYFLTSKSKLNSSAFSDYGIFKEVIK